MTRAMVRKEEFTQRAGDPNLLRFDPDPLPAVSVDVEVVPPFWTADVEGTQVREPPQRKLFLEKHASLENPIVASPPPPPPARPLAPVALNVFDGPQVCQLCLPVPWDRHVRRPAGAVSRFERDGPEAPHAAAARAGAQRRLGLGLSAVQ